jgi:hypothetical protein
MLQIIGGGCRRDVCEGDAQGESSNAGVKTQRKQADVDSSAGR